MTDKPSLRERMRRLRREHVAALPESVSRLMFLRPPSPIAALVPEGAHAGLYHAIGAEAPTRGYAEWFYENGRQLCLPWFADRDSPMLFREWGNPFDTEGLEPGPFGFPQPTADKSEVVPDVAFVPLIAFTASGERLGQGGGHYDRWLADHPATLPVGLAWDCQLAEELPMEPHDRVMAMVITPTRIYEGAA